MAGAGYTPTNIIPRKEHKDEDGNVVYDFTYTAVRNGPKIGRNEPCPCGSGTKYKKCCGKGN